MDEDPQSRFQRLEFIAERFSLLGSQLSQVAERLRSVEADLPKDLAEKVTTSCKNFAGLYARLLALTESLIASLRRAAEKTEQKRTTAEQVRRDALALLERVLALSYSRSQHFLPLERCKVQARRLRRFLTDPRRKDSLPEIQALAEGNHPLGALLTLVENSGELDNETWEGLRNTVAQAFGVPLAAAASRGQLLFPGKKNPKAFLENGAEPVPAKSPEQVLQEARQKALAEAQEAVEPETPVDLEGLGEPEGVPWRCVIGILGFFPPLLILLFMASHFRGLISLEALDYAQAARHLARGDGFITSVISPLSLTFRAQLNSHPDLSHSPFFVGLLALLFRLGGSTDRMAALGSVLGWLLSVWLTFALSYRLFGRGIAFLSTVLYLANGVMLAQAISGRPTTWITTFLLALGLALSGQRTSESRSFWRQVVWASFFWGLCYLTDALWTLPLGVVLILHWYRRLPYRAGEDDLFPPNPREGWLERFRWSWENKIAQPRHRAVALALMVFLVTVSPWAVRQYRVTGKPFFHLPYYEVLSQTPTFPGATIYERLDPGFSPFSFPVSRPREMFRKLALGLVKLRSTWLEVSDPYVAALFLMGLCIPLANPAAHSLRWTVVWMLVLYTGWVNLTAQRAEALLPFAPLVTMLGVAACFDMLKERAPQLTLGRFQVPPAVLQRLLAWGLFLFVAYPLIFTQSLLASQEPLPLPADGETLRRLTGPGEVIMTDIPEILAWHTNRPCLRLCQRDTDWQRIEGLLGPVQVIYFSPMVQYRPPEEWGDWWYLALRSTMGYREFSPRPSAQEGAVLLVRKTKRIPSNAFPIEEAP